MKQFKKLVVTLLAVVLCVSAIMISRYVRLEKVCARTA